MTANTSKSPSNSRKLSSEPRRTNKPLMEKRRRARINQSLSILKNLVVDSSQEKKPCKLEKADILELTVSYIQARKLKCASPVLNFKDGYKECTKAAVKFLESYNINQSTLDSLVEFLKVRQESQKKVACSFLDVTSRIAFPNPCPTFTTSNSGTSPITRGDLLNSSESEGALSQHGHSEMHQYQSNSSRMELTSYQKSLIIYPMTTGFENDCLPMTGFHADNVNCESLKKSLKSCPNSCCNKDTVDSCNMKTKCFKSIEDSNEPLDLCNYARLTQGECIWRPW